MIDFSYFKTNRKVWLAILFGILSLILSPYGIAAHMGNIHINIPWALFLPIIIGMALGWRFALIAGLSGGAFFPFLLWANNGWPNVSTSLLFLHFYVLLALVYEKTFLKKLKKMPVRIFLAFLIAIVVLYIYYLFLFNPILKLNPVFWAQNAINSIPIEVLYGIAFKDSLNIIILTIISDTLLRIPIIRILLGLHAPTSMQSNFKIFVLTIFISVLVWFSFVGLDILIFDEDDAIQNQHILLSLFVIMASGFFVTRMLFYYAENQYKIRNQLNKSEKKFRALFENSNDAIIIIENEIYNECNPVTLKIFGCSLNDMIGKSLYDFSPPYQSDGILSTEKSLPYLNSAKNGTSVRFDWLHNRLDGTTFDAEVSLSRLKINKKVLLQAIIRDISDRKQTEKELINAKEKAVESDRLKSAFLANMSHEIRTPMNGILGFAEILKISDLSDEQQQEYIGIIEKCGIRLLNIINDIIDISKIESGQISVFISETNVNEQMEFVYSFLKPEADQKLIRFLYQNNTLSNEIIIKTDREKLYAILINLVKNAIKYTDQGSIEFGYDSSLQHTQSNDGSITDSFDGSKELRFYVKDTGIGIPNTRHDAIFERFIQAEIVDKMARHGAGLGLAISKAYVEMLGGKIWVESEVGKGSTFYFTLPL